MNIIEEKHYSVDAGMGEKMEGCPYSLFEDGHDVRNYIIPPRGHVLKGFRLEPSDTPVYDGKLIAQFEKEPLRERMSAVWHVLAWILIASIIIGLITLLTIGIFKPQKPQNRNPHPVETPAIPIDTVMETETTTVDPQSPDTADNPAPEVATPVEVSVPVTETPQPVVADDNALFKQAFWDLIHKRELAMDAYDGLYKQYKGKVGGEEFDYLRTIILKDYPTYKEWSRKLRKLPTDQAETLESVKTLKAKLNDIK